MYPADTGQLEIGGRIVEQLASKRECLSQTSQEDILQNSHIIDDLKEQYQMLRIALVGDNTQLVIKR